MNIPFISNDLNEERWGLPVLAVVDSFIHSAIGKFLATVFEFDQDFMVNLQKGMIGAFLLLICKRGT